MDRKISFVKAWHVSKCIVAWVSNTIFFEYKVYGGLGTMVSCAVEADVWVTLHGTYYSRVYYVWHPHACWHQHVFVHVLPKGPDEHPCKCIALISVETSDLVSHGVTLLLASSNTTSNVYCTPPELHPILGCVSVHRGQLCSHWITRTSVCSFKVLEYNGYPPNARERCSTVVATW
jgi:hypothetical protein